MHALDSNSIVAQARLLHLTDCNAIDDAACFVGLIVALLDYKHEMHGYVTGLGYNICAGSGRGSESRDGSHRTAKQTVPVPRRGKRGQLLKTFDTHHEHIPQFNIGTRLAELALSTAINQLSSVERVAQYEGVKALGGCMRCAGTGHYSINWEYPDESCKCGSTRESHKAALSAYKPSYDFQGVSAMLCTYRERLHDVTAILQARAALEEGITARVVSGRKHQGKEGTLVRYSDSYGPSYLVTFDSGDSAWISTQHLEADPRPAYIPYELDQFMRSSGKFEWVGVTGSRKVLAKHKGAWLTLPAACKAVGLDISSFEWKVEPWTYQPK